MRIQHSAYVNGVNAACHAQASTSTNVQPDDVSLAACNVIGDRQVAPSSLEQSEIHANNRKQPDDVSLSEYKVIVALQVATLGSSEIASQTGKDPTMRIHCHG